MALPPEQRALLEAAKLRSRVEAHLDGPLAPATVSATAFAGGAAMVCDDEVWLSADELGGRALGPALAWSLGHGIAVGRLNVVAEDHAATLARRAAAFTEAPRVWQAAGLALQPASAAPMPGPSRDPVPDGVPRWMAELVGQLEAAEVDVVVDHGQVIGEVAGLEVARIVLDPGTDGAEPSARLEVGVGRHDREAFAILHADEDPFQALARVVATVREQRRPGAPPHPLNRLGAHRWLRSELVARPRLVGAAVLEPVPGLDPRPGVKDTSAVAAMGTDDAGRPVLVVCSVGIDLDLVPSAADLRLAHDPEARLVLVVPERDAHPITRRLAASLIQPAEVVALPGDWREGVEARRYPC